MTREVEVCPVCGHKSSPGWAKVFGAAIGVLVLTIVVVVLVGVLVAAVRWAF